MVPHKLHFSEDGMLYKACTIPLTSCKTSAILYSMHEMWESISSPVLVSARDVCVGTKGVGGTGRTRGWGGEQEGTEVEVGITGDTMATTEGECNGKFLVKLTL